MKKMTFMILGLFITLASTNTSAAELERFSAPKNTTATLDDGDACSTASFLLNNEDYDQAKLVLDSMFAEGEACAQFYLGKMYVDGTGVKQNGSKGLDMINSAAKKGYAPANAYKTSNH